LASASQLSAICSAVGAGVDGGRPGRRLGLRAPSRSGVDLLLPFLLLLPRVRVCVAMSFSLYYDTEVSAWVDSDLDGYVNSYTISRLSDWRNLVVIWVTTQPLCCRPLCFFTILPLRVEDDMSVAFLNDPERAVRDWCVFHFAP
jgi:hypothetical protein